jgi:hypothetical protein
VGIARPAGVLLSVVGHPDYDCLLNHYRWYVHHFEQYSGDRRYDPSNCRYCRRDSMFDDDDCSKYLILYPGDDLVYSAYPICSGYFDDPARSTYSDDPEDQAYATYLFYLPVVHLFAPFF